MRFARGLGTCSPEKIIKNYVIWCILVNILIRFCLEKLPFFYVNNYNSYTLVMGYLVSSKNLMSLYPGRDVEAPGRSGIYSNISGIYRIIIYFYREYIAIYREYRLLHRHVLCHSNTSEFEHFNFNRNLF